MKSTPAIPRLVAILGLITTSKASDLIVTTDEGDGADSHVAVSDPDSNFGEEVAVRIKNAAATESGVDFDRKGYLRFDVSDVETGNISSVSFEMTVTDEEAGKPVSGPQRFSVFGLIDGIDDLWGEFDITWNSAPANVTDSGNGVTSDAVLLGEFSLNGTGAPGESVQLESTLILDFFLADTNGLLTLIVVRDTFDKDSGGWVHSFASREHPDLGPPRLTFIVDDCPADLDGSGAVDFDDLLRVLATWGNAGGPEDLDGSGFVDFGDLLIVLTAWGPCE